MQQLIRLTLVVTALSVLGACVLVPVGPRRGGYYERPAVFVPVGVRAYRRC